MKKLICAICFIFISIFCFSQKSTSELTLEYLKNNFSVSVPNVPTLKILNTSRDTLDIKFYDPDANVYFCQMNGVSDDTIYINTMNFKKSLFKVIIKNITRKETIKSYIDIE